MRTRFVRICAGILLVILAGMGRPVIGQEGGPPQADGPAVSIQEPSPESGASPDISFIDNPSATCYQPVAGRNECYVNWTYLNVTASASQYVITMTVAIDSRVRAVYQGFFASSIYIPGDIHGEGFKVSCGDLGSGGNPQLGSAHSYTIRARETGGLQAANYGTVLCPSVPLIYLPVALRN